MCVEISSAPIELPINVTKPTFGQDFVLCPRVWQTILAPLPDVLSLVTKEEKFAYIGRAMSEIGGENGGDPLAGVVPIAGASEHFPDSAFVPD